MTVFFFLMPQKCKRNCHAVLICLKRRTNRNYKTRRIKTFFLNEHENAENLPGNLDGGGEVVYTEGINFMGNEIQKYPDFSNCTIQY